MQPEQRRNTRAGAGTVPLRFGTKAETLQRVAPRLRSAIVLDLIYFTVEQWARTRNRCLQRVAARFGSATLAVRSSALAEDGAQGSMAGAFESVLRVSGGYASAVGAAIDRVAAALTGNPRDQILIQPMLEDVAVSGVIMTHDLVLGAPYYVINFDDETGRTDSVTAGQGVHKALRVYRNAPPDFIQSPRVARFLALARRCNRYLQLGADTLLADVVVERPRAERAVEANVFAVERRVHGTRIELRRRRFSLRHLPSRHRAPFGGV